MTSLALGGDARRAEILRDEAQQRLLVVVAGAHRVGVPVACVRETMRPLPVEPLRDAPPFVLGLSLIRGASVPILDLGGLLGREGRADAFGRFVTVAVEGRSVALAVACVEGVVALQNSDFLALPPLLARAAGGAVEAMTLHDEAFLLVLRASRIVPAAPPRPDEAAP